MHGHLTRFDRIARHLWLGVFLGSCLAVLVLIGIIIGVSAF